MCSVSPSARALFLPLLLSFSCLLLSSAAVSSAQPPGGEQASAEEQKEKIAADRFLDLLIKKPAAGTALDRVFGYHVERGTIANLIEQLGQTAAQSMSPDESGRYFLLLGLLQLQRGEDAQAVTALDTAQTLLKDNPQAAFHHGQALLLVGKTDTAASAFEAAIARKPARTDYLNVARELGRLYQRAGRTDDALRIWNDLEKNFPGDDSVRARIAATLVEEGDLAGALVRYEAMAKAAKAENDRITFALDAARLRSQVGQKEQALKDFDALLSKLRPGSYLYDEARRRIEGMFLSNGDYAGLTQYYGKWLEDHPDDLNVILRMARTLSLQGRSGEAIQRFEQAIERAPNDEGARLACIDAYMAANRYADAATQFEALIKANPKNPDYLVRYGQVLFSDKAKPEAERAKAAAEVWKRLSAAKPKDAAVQSQVADLLRSAKLTDDAIAGYRAAIALAPDEPQHKEYLGEYLHQLKRTDEAMAVWRSLAEGNARNLDNLARLAEVFHQFEQPAEALKVMAEACQLKPKVMHRLRYAEWLADAKEFDKANEQLDLARHEADNVEDRARTFAAAVKTYKAAGKLDEQIKVASAALQTKPDDGQLWRQLAMLHEANDNAAEALKAIEKAVEAEPNVIETLDLAARMTEASGRTAEAIDLRKRLVDIDRRFRSAHLQRLATLYGSAGKPELAIATGKELLASAGGAIDAFRFYADLCGQLGRTDERLDTLRRCLRLNPRSVEAIEMLSGQLAEDFKTDQAIELVWKQLDLAEDIEKRRVAVAKLTDLYLRSNRLDQLINRLEFRGREANDRRTSIDLIATAYQQAGDLGLARDALESLLNESGRDTLLMERMVSLAEQAGEVDRAVELQRELLRLTPGKQAESRLASLLIDVGALDEAQALWLSSVDIRADVTQIVRSIDQLFLSGEYKAAYDLTNKILAADPSDWEMLTRRMVLSALADEWESAEKDAQAILAMNVGDDEESNATKQRKAKEKKSLNQLAQSRYPANYPKELVNIYGALELSRMLDPRYGYRNNRLPVPEAFGGAKFYAKFVLLKRAEDKGESDGLLAKLKETAMSEKATAKDVLDWYASDMLAAGLKQSSSEHFRDPETWTANWRLLDLAPSIGLTLLSTQFSNRERYAYNNEFPMKPLSSERLQWLKEQAYKSIGVPSSNVYAPVNWMSAYAAELLIAGRKEEANAVLKEKKNWPEANGPDAYRVLSMIHEQGSDDELWQAIEQAMASDKSNPKQVAQRSTSPMILAGLFNDPSRVTKKLSAGPDDATFRRRLMQLVDKVIDEYALQPTRGQTLRLTSIGGPRQSYQMIGNNYQQIVIEFPPTGLGPNDDTVQRLYATHQTLKDHAADWVQHLLASDESRDQRVKVQRLVAAAFAQQWSEKTNEAQQLLEQALKIAVEHVPQQESTLRLLLADLLLRQDRKQEALAMIEQLSVYDQNAMAVREFAAARLASVLGDKPRAEQAARRLIGVRLDSDAQIELAKLMRSLNMNDLAADVVRRLRGRTGSTNTQLQALLNYFVSQKEKEAAAEVAMDLLQRTAPTPKRQGSGMTADQSLRNQALQALADSGKLAPLVESTKKRLERAPNSQRIRAELADMYRVTGQVKELDELLNKKGDQKVESTATLEANAKQLVAASKWAEACDAYLKVLRRNPQLFSRGFYDIERPFAQTKRLGELADVIMEVGVQKFESYRVSEMCERLIRNEQNYDKARQLFLAMLGQRNSGQNVAQSLNNVSSDYRYLINDEAMLLKVVDALIGVSVGRLATNSWSDAFSGYSTSGDGRKNNGLTSLVRFVADNPAMAQALETRLKSELVKEKDWLEGRIWLGLLMTATKRYDEARPLLEPLLTNRPAGGRESLWLIGSLIDSHPPLHDLAEKLYEIAFKDSDSIQNFNDSDFQYTLAARISQFMLERGNKPRAREIVLAELDRRGKNPTRRNFGDPSYEAYETINQTMSMMKFLTQVDAHVEALKLARKLDRSNFAKAAQYTDSNEATFDRQVKDIESHLAQAGGLTLVESMIDAEAKGASAVEFGITLDDRPFTGSGLKSLWLEMLASGANQPEQADALAKLRDRLQQIAEKRPLDTSCRFALALTNSYGGSRELLEAIVKDGFKTNAVGPNADQNAAPSIDSKTQSQWLALAYLRWSELEQSQQPAFDVSIVQKWLASHGQDLTSESRVQLLAALGKRQLAKQDSPSAAALWGLCLEQPDVTQWALIDLALAAARESLTELSLRSAVASANGTDQLPGSETAKEASSLGQLLGAQQRQNSSTPRNANLDNDSKSPLASRIIELDNLWSSQKVEPKQLIEPLSKLVALEDASLLPLPVKYEPSGSNDWKLESVFDRLAKRAHQCSQTDALVAKLASSAKNAVDQTAASPEQLAKSEPLKALLIALAWLRHDQGDKAVEYLKAIDKTQLNSVHRTLVLQTLLAGLANSSCRVAAAELGLAWAGTNKPSQRYAAVAPFDRLTLEIARQAIQHNLANELRSTAVAQYLELCQHENDRYQGTTRSTQFINQLGEIAQMYLTHGSNAEALVYLGQRQALFNQGFDRDDDWLGSWLLESMQSQGNRQEAYQLLDEWTFRGDLGLNNIMAFSRRAPLPDWIPESVGGQYPKYAPMADKSVPLVSSFYSLALLSAEVQQSDALIARYQAAHQQKRPGAAAGLAITLAALKRPVPNELLKELSDRMVTIRPEGRSNQARTAAPLAELNLALELNSRQEHSEWVRDTISEVERHGVPVGRTYLTPWLARYSYQQGWSPLKDMKPTEGLKHWTFTMTGSAKDYYEGKTAPQWLMDGQEQIAHLCGSTADWMWWRYPLEGNFEFEFETQEGSGREMEFYAAGLRFAATSSYADITSEDSRDWLRMSSTHAKKDEWNKYKLVVDDKQLKYFINGEVLYQEPRSPGPVWLALRSLGVRQTISRNIKFSGQPKIASSVSLIGDDQLRGWSGYYYTQALPSSKLAAATGESSNQSLRTGLKSDDKANLSWTIENGELVSGAGRTSGPDKQSVVQYLRPMSVGDKLEFEFYYEPGKFEVHPMMGRTAFLLRPAGIERHWTTEPSTSWKTPADNHFPIEGARPLALKAGQWNSATLETLSDKVRIAINGQEAMELPWKFDESSAIFGLFHVQGQTQARVRKMTLSGSWPTAIPVELWER